MAPICALNRIFSRCGGCSGHRRGGGEESKSNGEELHEVESIAETARERVDDQLRAEVLVLYMSDRGVKQVVCLD